jgi:MFS family permease
MEKKTLSGWGRTKTHLFKVGAPDPTDSYKALDLESVCYLDSSSARITHGHTDLATMGILTLAEDRPTPPSVYNWRIYVLAVVASCGSNMIGYTSAFIGTTITLDSFKKEFGIDKKTVEERNLISENIVSLFIAGAFFGALLTYVMSHWVGRKWCLAIASATFTLGAGLQCGADSSTGLGILYAGRVLSGLGTGFASNIIPIYISELAPPAIRGRLVGLYELGWQIGGLVGFWINVSQDFIPLDIAHLLTFG